MTVATSTSKSGPYAGAGTTGPFTVDFRFLENPHLMLVKTSALGVETVLVLDSDYTVAGAGAASGTVTLAAALPSGQTLTIVRNVPATQEADYVQNDAFPAESHERALDKLTMLTQQNSEQLARAMKLPVSLEGVSTAMPLPVAGRGLKWNAGATALVNSDQDLDALAAGASDQAAAAAASAAAAAATLDAFDDRYLGAKASDPALDNDGAALTESALYWNSVSKEFRVFNGTIWQVVVPSGNLQKITFVNGVDFTAGVTTTLSLPTDPLVKANLDIVFDAAWQQMTEYSLAGLVITFNAPIPVGVGQVEISYTTPLQITSLQGPDGVLLVGNAVDARDLAASTGAGLVGFSQPLTTPKLVTQHTINKYRLYADQIAGIDADGADCSAPLQVLVNEMLANGYQELVFGSGTYTFQNVNVPSKIQIAGQGRNTKLLKPVGSGVGSHLLRFNGSVGAASSLTANGSAFALSVTVVNGALFTAGNYVLLRAAVYVSGSAGRRQEIKRIASIAGNVLTFTTPLLEDYTTAATSEVCILNPVVGASLSNVSLEGQNANLKGGLIKSLYGIDLMLDGVHGQYMSDQAAFSFGTCLNATIQFCSAKDGINMAAGGYGYGAEFDEATTFSKIVDSYFENVRECTFTNRTRYSKFARNTCVNTYDGGVNTHGAYVTNCEIEDNEIIGVTSGNGISVGYGSHGAGDEKITIKRNRIKNTGGNGISIAAPVGLENYQIRVFDNEINNVGLAASSSCLWLQQSTNVETGNNRLEGVGNNAANGIYANAVTGWESNGDVIRTIPNGYGLTVDGCTTVNVNDMSVSGVSSYNVRGIGTNSGVRVHLKYRDDNTMSLGAGISYTGRTMQGGGTLTFAAEAAKSAVITFEVPYPAGVVPSVVPSVENNLGNFRANPSSVSNTGFTVNVTDTGGAARTGSVNYHWTAAERA